MTESEVREALYPRRSAEAQNGNILIRWLDRNALQAWRPRQGTTTLSFSGPVQCDFRYFECA